MIACMIQSLARSHLIILSACATRDMGDGQRVFRGWQPFRGRKISHIATWDFEAERLRSTPIQLGLAQEAGHSQLCSFRGAEAPEFLEPVGRGRAD